MNDRPTVNVYGWWTPGYPPKALGDRWSSSTPPGSFTSTCDNNLNFSGNETDYSFIGEAELENTGNVGIVARVVATWGQLGSAPVRVVRQVKVPYSGSRTVRFNIPATSQQIDLHQSAERDCAIKVRIIDTFGKTH